MNAKHQAAQTRAPLIAALAIIDIICVAFAIAAAI